jgi:hypothetical protein
VASNPGAQFSASGFDTLSTRAGTDDVLAEKVAQRGDVPPHIFCRILMQASDAVRCRILAVAPATLHGDLARIVEDVAGRMADEAPVTRDFGSATRYILRSFPEGRILETDLMRLVLARRYEEIVAALSVMSGISVDTIHQLLDDLRVEPLQFLCKALELSWTVARALLQLKLGGMSAEATKAAAEEFEKLPLDAAKRMLTLWQARDRG